MKSFKQYLEMVDPEKYERIVSDISISTKKWNKVNEYNEGGWDSFKSNPEATEKYIDWVTGRRGF